MADAETPKDAPRGGKSAKSAPEPELELETAAAEAAGGVGGIAGSIPEFDEDATESGAPTAALPGPGGHSIQAMLNVDLDVKVVLGACKMPISTLLKLSRGSVIELDQRIGQPVDLVINDRLVARGDLVKLPGDRIGVSLTEIVRDHVTDF
ncbi:FliM/FliN family flagellar motor switch protein [Litorisediminicola beolgyonensis]|uniref:Flagellar motor switch protein FliN n=1 Tax=Litorisediminicola beolgyonensis TaxID=1173614 RepID=A0ABW3ZFQ4_9RHOB